MLVLMIEKFTNAILHADVYISYQGISCQCKPDQLVIHHSIAVLLCCFYSRSYQQH